MGQKNVVNNKSFYDNVILCYCLTIPSDIQQLIINDLKFLYVQNLKNCSRKYKHLHSIFNVNNNFNYKDNSYGINMLKHLPNYERLVAGCKPKQ